MIRSRREFWIFHATFRLLAGIALFLYGLAYGHVRVAVIRSVYNPLIGFACSYIIRAAIESWFPRVLLKWLLMIFGLSFAGELISAFIVDPITFGLPGYDLGQIPLRNLLQDGLYFVLLYLVWSLLYLQLSGKLLVAATTRLPIRPSPLIKQRWLILPVRLRE